MMRPVRYAMFPTFCALFVMLLALPLSGETLDVVPELESSPGLIQLAKQDTSPAQCAAEENIAALPSSYIYSCGRPCNIEGELAACHDITSGIHGLCWCYNGYWDCLFVDD